VTRTAPSQAVDFLRFLRTPAAQQVFADFGYRPVVKSVEDANRKKFPTRPGLFTIDQLGLGGWQKVQKRFFDPESSVMATIQRQVGGSTD
jgi:sulfate transport system substrate-binding protein